MIELILSFLLVSVWGIGVLLYFVLLAIESRETAQGLPHRTPGVVRAPKAFPKKAAGKTTPKVNDDLQAWKQENDEA